MDLSQIEPRFKKMFEQIENYKNAFENAHGDFSTFACTRWANSLQGLFVDQLEELSRTHEPEYIGQYVIEFFVSLIDENSLEL